MFSWLDYREESTEGTTFGLEMETVRSLSIGVLWVQLLPILCALLNHRWMVEAAFVVGLVSAIVALLLYNRAKQFRALTVCKLAIVIGGAMTFFWLLVCLSNLV